MKGSLQIYDKTSLLRSRWPHEAAAYAVSSYGHSKGNQKGRWAISVSGNWRVTFEFVDGKVYVIDYEDYH